MKVKTSELTPQQLNAVVSNIEGHEANYATDWAHGGPIIEEERILLDHDGLDEWEEWEGRIVGVRMEYGPTPLIAAMRCYVGSRLGNEVEVPDELVSNTMKV